MNYQLRQSGYTSLKLTDEQDTSPFEKLFDIFKELITYTSGDFDEAIDWFKALDKEYNLTSRRLHHRRLYRRS